MLQANYNRLLDVARETYKENVGDILQLTNSLVQEHEVPLQASYQAGGFVFSLKKAELEGPFPPGFINVTSKGQRWIFSSVELVSPRTKCCLSSRSAVRKSGMRD